MKRKIILKPHTKFSSNFDKDIDNTPLEIQDAFRDAYDMFSDDPNNEILRNHSLNKLGKRYYGLWSIDVTDDWRAVYRKKGDQKLSV